jgi:hypothetical protein
VDTEIELWSAVSSTYLLSDDDGGTGTFSLISGWVCPSTGTYYVAVHHYATSGTGTYAISVY